MLTFQLFAARRNLTCVLKIFSFPQSKVGFDASHPSDSLNFS